VLFTARTIDENRQDDVESSINAAARRLFRRPDNTKQFSRTKPRNYSSRQGNRR